MNIESLVRDMKSSPLSEEEKLELVTCWLIELAEANNAHKSAKVKKDSALDANDAQDWDNLELHDMQQQGW